MSMRAKKELENLISREYPQLIDRIRQSIEVSERSFSEDRNHEKESVDSFLWEHTLHVAAIARQIALAEIGSATDAVIAALFHDSGKFHEGHYHPDDIPEEEESARLAEKLLTDEGMDEEKIRTITSSLTALYNENQQPTQITDIVHDADFLAKFGYLGVVHFLVKSAVRGQNLYNTLVSSLSKELTYAASLSANMRTCAGKTLAEKKSEATLEYFRGLLAELREAGIAFFNILEEAFPCPENPDKMFNLWLAMPEACPECGETLSINLESQAHTKCERLTADIRCAQCPNNYQVSFCLPEIAC